MVIVEGEMALSAEEIFLSLDESDRAAIAARVMDVLRSGGAGSGKVATRELHRLVQARLRSPSGTAGS